MSFIKKNLLFCIVAVLCLAGLIGGIFMTFAEYGKVKEARNSLAGTEAQLSSLLNAEPAPTKENLAAAEQNLAELRAALAEIREELQSGTELDTSEDGISVIAGIQQFIFKFQREAAENKNQAGEAAPIETPKNFAFGFEKYIDEATPPEGPEKISRLDKQRLILRYLLTQLMTADPHSISSVKREILESGDTKDKNSQKGFSIDPALSARVPGAIDTMAFSLTFSGYTDSLREFLNSLAGFEFPIVVRSIQVTRPSGDKAVVKPPRRSEADGFLGLFGDEPSQAAAGTGAGQPPAPVQEPVIQENLSKFTIILEYFEVVLPDASTTEVSDPA